MSSLVAEQWEDADIWWEEHVREQLEDLHQIRTLIAVLGTEWEDNSSVFTHDPLEEDWQAETPMQGPLRTNQEENWSQWLAHLIRSSNGSFTGSLFGCQDIKVHSVTREEHFSSDSHHDRRMDIVVECADRCMSIEVKIEDENFGKSPEAAYLAETNTPACSTWDHYLLVPERKHGQLEAAFGTDFTEFPDRRPRIESESFVDLDIIYWKDVAFALRTAIDDEASEHWEASAFAFITLIEQKIANFHSLSSVEQLTGGSTVIDIHHSSGLELEDQITYLAEFNGGDEHGQ